MDKWDENSGDLDTEVEEAEPPKPDESTLEELDTEVAEPPKPDERTLLLECYSDIYCVRLFYSFRYCVSHTRTLVRNDRIAFVMP